ncbi:DUF3732 domain-containing protein [Arthrobacter sp. BE255]|uniref:DUF3732 domain-containing protein n=1 Tax=Arthrobacter sp. BE255 TaxID=2817721 RepID=UPI002863D7F3|nr:DUF3732 domain-containing protein [Arthrobacter sp. BE255]MDR7160934.1 putative nucleic acid-binding Zn-ribbon protein [Arthrobacter sp. BE255]
MLEFGGDDLDGFQLRDLEVNTDSDALRSQVGLRIGLPEVRFEPSQYSTRSPYSIGLGSAALFCFQGQDEIASRSLLFHRQAERGIDQTLKDALPFFLGALQEDQATKRAQLRDARRDLRRAELSLTDAESTAQTTDITLQALLSEAHSAGMTDRPSAPDIRATVAVLSSIRFSGSKELDRDSDLRSQDARREIEGQRAELRQQMKQLLSERDLLLDFRSGEGSYQRSVALQTGRMTSLDLLRAGHKGPQADGVTDHCPVCSQELTTPDPAASQLEQRLSELRKELVTLAAAEPNRRAALIRLEDSVSELRTQLQALDRALETVNLRGNEARTVSDAESREFIRGRIDAILGRHSYADDNHLGVLKRQAEAARASVIALEQELDDDEAREQLTSRLVALGRDMTAFAEKLALEHAEKGVRLDLAKLTVVVDSETGPIPMYGIGSAANSIGYHLVTHLALHRFFTRQNRPVPRFLMLDQPTQAYYESEEEKRSGRPSDRTAVLAMFRLMKDVVEELSPDFQIIVSDHADLSEDWFADSVVHNWRDDKLVPLSWL